MLSNLIFGSSSSDSSAGASNAASTNRNADKKSETGLDSHSVRERRASQRAPSRCLARVWGPGAENPIFGRLQDLSESGCRLMTETTFDTGDSVTIELTVLGRTPRITIEATGIVRHRDQSSDRQAYGIEFEHLDASTEQAVEWLYDREKTLHPLNTRPTTE